jgi:hypothetical protein
LTISRGLVNMTCEAPACKHIVTYNELVKHNTKYNMNKRCNSTIFVKFSHTCYSITSISHCATLHNKYYKFIVQIYYNGKQWGNITTVQSVSSLLYSLSLLQSFLPKLVLSRLSWLTCLASNHSSVIENVFT